MKKRFILILGLFCLLSEAGAQEEKGIELNGTPNLFIGTADDYGQMSPGAAMPFGQIQVGPDSNPRQHPGYDYEQPIISGFSINRLSGVGGSGCGGNVSLMPDATGKDVKLLKESEKASPGTYEVDLSNGVHFFTTATRNMAVERFTFPSSQGQILLLNPASSFEKCHKAEFQQLEPRVGQGMAECSNTCGRGRYHLYYKFFSSVPFEMETFENGMRKLTFSTNTKRELEIRIVASTGLESELKQIDSLKVWNEDAHSIAIQAQNEWAHILNRISVEGGTEDQKTIFYTSLYRTFHSPFQITDKTFRKYLGTDGQTHTAETGSEYYSSWSLWDTYRTKFPLITLLQPKRSKDIMQSLAQLYVTGKKDWSTPYECAPTVRTEHAVATLLDAYRQGIAIPNLKKAYPGMKNEMENLPLKSPDQCLEAASDFWALSELANELGLHEDASKWKARGEEIFDSIWPREFMNIDSTFTKMRGNGLYQGTRWQYRWGAPMYLYRMESLVGKKELGKQLKTFFEQELYNQGNEPDIHVPFLFGRLGMPRETGKVVYPLSQEIITHRYGGNDAYPTPYVGQAFVNAPRGYCPEMDEDDGAMSAWYVFSCIGMYPTIVGEAAYDLFSPIFDRITIQLDEEGECQLTIRTKGRTNPKQVLKKVLWNGKPLKKFQIKHKQLRHGGELVYCY
ncbi:MAG: glycoside hydrolase family 92 protein [Bacteroidaceae bacterium]|nr:glycoside hydrolase family 92 protein [Bacteroidaceae bacterium]